MTARTTGKSVTAVQRAGDLDALHDARSTARSTSCGQGHEPACAGSPHVARRYARQRPHYRPRLSPEHHLSLLREIQAGILQEKPDLASILLKLRLLAARLGSEPLADWVKHEAEGYPLGAEVPPYRTVSVSYKGSFSGPWGSSINNAPIPAHLIETHASADWTRKKVHQSMASVQEMAASEEGVGLDASNLILLLQGKVYAEMACIAVSGSVSAYALREIVQAVRVRILELTIELEKRVPEAVEVSLVSEPASLDRKAAVVSQVYFQTVHGSVTNVTATDAARVTLAITAGDKRSLISELVKAGVPEEAALEFSGVLEDEQPVSADQTLGRRALDWVKENAPKAASEAWKLGSTAASEVLKEAALRYYGLK